MKVLHVFFSSVVNPQHRFLGTTKDIRGRTEYFLKRMIDYQELILKIRKEKYFRRGLQEIDLKKFDAVLIEGAYYPGSVRYLKTNYPHLKIIIRGINAELFHWMHSAYAAVTFDSLKRAIGDLKGVVQFGLSDIRCGRQADYVLPIAQWETLHYWNKFVPRRRLATVPYFLPDSYLKTIPSSRPKKPQCVCMMTTKAGRPFLLDAARELFKLVNQLGDGEPQWSFCITGDFRPELLPPCPRVEVKGFLENPLELLAESRAVALLSDYGFGFKTKLLDAICCGCFLLVKKKLYSRLPPEVQRYCIVIDVRSINSFRDALARCLDPFPPGDPNGALREEAFSALDRVLGVSGQTQLSLSAG